MDNIFNINFWISQWENDQQNNAFSISRKHKGVAAVAILENGVKIMNHIGICFVNGGVKGKRELKINRKQNYTSIEIGSLQIFGGAKYGNI